jgi:serine/threonine protein kinase
MPSDAPGGLCPACVLLGASGEIDPPGIPSLEEIQTAFPQFEILECIGRGGMGVVYKVRQPQLDRLLALKILLPGLDHDPGFAERFSREARALAKLGHPNIVAVHDFGETGGFFWLTMEYVDGVNLRQAMQAARFTPAQALALIPDLCAALQYAHDHGILHRDIKPENILLDTRGKVKIADFGIARIAGDDRNEFTLTRTGSVLGSAAYIAPEQIERPQDVDHRADLYSLGVVFYEMLTGELPLGRFPAPSEKSASDPRLDEVVFRTLEKEREKRYQSADALKGGVETAQANPPPSTKLQSLDSTNLPSRILPWSLGLLGGGLITSGVGYFTSPTILGLGAIAFIFGTLGCWWLLIGMKSGRCETTHRKLLLTVAFFPALLGLLWLVSISPLLNFPDMIYSRQPLPLLWIILPFVVSVIGGKLLWKLISLPGNDPPTPRFGTFQKFAFITGTLALLLSMLAAKHMSVQLNLLKNYHGYTFLIREARTFNLLKDEDAALVKEAATKAAGEYAGLYRIEYPPWFRAKDRSNSLNRPGTMGIDFVLDVPWSAERATEHIKSYEHRLRSLLPPRIRIDSGNRGLHDREVQQVQTMTRGVFSLALVILLGSASLLSIFTRKKDFIVTLAAGLIATVVLNAISTWPIPAILPPSLGDRPALPALPVHDEDFSSAESAVNSLLKAAELGNAPTFLKALNTDRLTADQIVEIQEFMPFFAACKRDGPFEFEDSGSTAKAFMTFWSQRLPNKPRMREGFNLPLLSKEGRWSIDGDKLPGLFNYLRDRAAFPYFESDE